MFYEKGKILDVDYAHLYSLDIHQFMCPGGISLDDYNENQIMNEIAGISWHSSIMLGDIFGKMVCGFNDNHFALVLSLKPYPSGVIDFQVQDQTGCHDISASYVDSYYY